MQIDWFTLGAQAFNFVLLAVLLWYVLYRPIRRAVDRREEEIRSRVEEARKEKEEAEEIREEQRRKEAELEEERDSILREAREEAEERREELLAEIREDMDQTREEWKKSLRRDREGFLEELSERVRDEAFHLLRRGLEDLVDTRPREAFRDAFLRKARDLSEEEREAFARAVESSGNVCRIRSSLDLEKEDGEPIRDLVEGWLEENGKNPSVEVEMEVEEDGPRGIELWAGDRKMAWTVESYVEGLRNEVEGILKSETRSGAEGERKEERDEGSGHGKEEGDEEGEDEIDEDAEGEKEKKE